MAGRFVRSGDRVIAASASVALLGELIDLKRVDHGGVSVASRAFTRAWGALCAQEEDPSLIARRETALALAATRLGAIDAGVLLDAGLTPDEAVDVLRTAALDAGAPEDVADALLEPGGEGHAAVPPFTAALMAQPRAGITAPGMPRLVLVPTESHAEHCWAVAVIGALLAEPADRGRAFVCGLAHHLHNAFLPDAGFAGEMALGDRLDGIVHRFTERALAQLPPAVEACVRDAMRLIGQVEEPAAEAFNAADVLDRVLELRWHEKANAFGLPVALDEYEIVHEGPLQAFGLEVLEQWALR